MDDLRILTLYKQHYMDEYPRPLTCAYSCIGYYDGLDLTPVTSEKNKGLLDKNRQNIISPLWYGAAKKTLNLESGYGEQNIGIFRSEKSNSIHADEFWTEAKKMPFMMVVFLQLSDESVYELAKERIENEWGGRIFDPMTEPGCKALVYYTFDNADLIVVTYGNSVSTLMNMLQEIEQSNLVAYVHSIMSISEAYLFDNLAKQDILEIWKGTKCFIDEPLCQISMHLATNGNRTVSEKAIQVLMDLNDGNMNGLHGFKTLKGFDKGVCSYTVGHKNMEISLLNSDVRSLLILILPGSFVTHQNGLYEHGIYNIETTISCKTALTMPLSNNLLSKKTFSQGNEQKSEHIIRSWCYDQISKCKELALCAYENGNEGLYAGFQSMIQTLNTLAQYERFKLSKKIFTMLYQAVEMFSKQLNEAIANTPQDRIRTIKGPIQEFLESVNSVIYHTIHTDQIFLMVPGCSGTAFTIPLKLNLMYLSFLNSVTNLLNDNNNKYACILTPVTELAPATKIIDFGLNNHDRLVCVKLPQRLLFFPASLMIILAHEAAHYIGDSLRCRRARTIYLIKILAHYLPEIIFPDIDLTNTSCSLDEKRVLTAYYAMAKPKLQEIVFEHLSYGVKDESDQMVDVDTIHYSIKLCPLLTKLCQELLAPEKGAVYNTIFGVTADLWNICTDSSIEDGLGILSRLQQEANQKRQELCASNLISYAIGSLTIIFRELFSDVAAVKLLDCTEQAYQEAYLVSEGIQFHSSEYSLRSAIIHSALYSESGSNIAFIEIEEDFFLARDSMGTSAVNLFGLRATQKYLKDYANDCSQAIENHISEHDLNEELNQVRKLYAVFTRGEFYMADIYGCMIRANNDYICFVENIHKD